MFTETNIFWIFPLITILSLILVRKIPHKINPKRVVKTPPPLDPYSYISVNFSEYHLIDRICQNLIAKKCMLFQLSEAGTLGVFKIDITDERYKKLHPLESYVYRKSPSKPMKYEDFISEIYGYEFSKSNEKTLDRYENNWARSGLVFPKSRLKIQQWLTGLTGLALFIFSIYLLGYTSSDKQAVLLIVELSIMLIIGFVIVAAISYPKITPRAKNYIKTTLLEMSNRKLKTKEQFIYASLNPTYCVSDINREFKKALEKNKPYSLTKNSPNELDDSIYFSVSSCSSCSCDSCSCS